jgi:single-strand DNA-binding protein
MSNVITKKGKIFRIFDTQQVSDKFQKREFVLETIFQGKFGDDIDHLKMQVKQERCGMLDNLKLGDEVTVNIDITGRMWVNPETNEEVFFTTLEIWKIEPTVAQNAPVAPVAPPAVAPPVLNQGVDGLPGAGEGKNPDDLPF